MSTDQPTHQRTHCRCKNVPEQKNNVKNVLKNRGKIYIYKVEKRLLHAHQHTDEGQVQDNSLFHPLRAAKLSITVSNNLHTV